MEFWGVEVKAGQPLLVKPDAGRVIHMSQAALGEGKKEKGNDLVPLRVNTNGAMFVVGSLSWDKFPQVAFDLLFDKDFELSHDWKNGSVFFCGYSADNTLPVDEDEYESESSDEEEDTLVGITENGKIEPKVEVVKPTASKGKAAKPEASAKPKVTVVEPKKDDKSDKSDESDDDEDETDDDEDMLDASDDITDSEDEDDSENEDEETPKKADPSKKRPTESATKTPIPDKKKRATDSATKTPVPSKKAKLDTPQKTDGKKGGGHTATPHPSKKAGKTPDNTSNKPKDQTPNSDANVTCKSCTRTFKSEGALESHTKAKHAAGK